MPNLYLVELTVSDLERSLLWYARWLDGEPQRLDRDRGFALFATGTGRLALKQGTAQPGTTLCTFETADLDAELARLAAAGILPEGELKTSEEGYRRARFRDPDGNHLCLFAWVR